LLLISENEDKPIQDLISEYTSLANSYTEGFVVTVDDYDLSYLTMIKKYDLYGGVK